jgi:hypothetical protein
VLPPAEIRGRPELFTSSPAAKRGKYLSNGPCQAEYVWQQETQINAANLLFVLELAIDYK